MEDKDYPVRIIGRFHPHVGETGVIQSFDGKVEVAMFGKAKMFKVMLDACPEGFESTICSLDQMARAGKAKKRKGAVRRE